ncbi:hypothetical protein FSP39_013075 [Pinctada imbricata]|uniref:Uncharacterized protein n=1 Tax=Pinctada imbricata TaxID=66713 RepID=A0AA89BZR8_PINIB|nr:hypothetical protein FSP39_013075 [Pinctada imbricata]
MPWIRGQAGFRENDEKFWLTWIVLLVLRLPGTIRTFIYISDATDPDHTYTDKYLLYMQSFGDAGQAFVNCIIYCLFDSDVRDYIREGFIEYKNELWYGGVHVSPQSHLRRVTSSDHLLAK